MSASMTAMHEAGHVVAAFLLGLATTSATVVPKGQNLGLVKFKDATATFEADPAKARKLMVATLAARAAVGGVYRDAGDGCGADDDQVWEAARSIVGDDPAHAAEVGLLVRECWEEAQELADDYHQAIADVARNLDCFGTMRGEFLSGMVERYVEQDRASPAAQRHRETRRKFRLWLEEMSQGGNTNGNE